MNRIARTDARCDDDAIDEFAQRWPCASLLASPRRVFDASSVRYQCANQAADADRGGTTKNQPAEAGPIKRVYRPVLYWLELGVRVDPLGEVSVLLLPDGFI